MFLQFTENIHLVGWNKIFVFLVILVKFRPSGGQNVAAIDCFQLTLVTQSDLYMVYTHTG